MLGEVPGDFREREHRRIVMFAETLIVPPLAAKLSRLDQLQTAALSGMPNVLPKYRRIREGNACRGSISYCPCPLGTLYRFGHHRIPPRSLAPDFFRTKRRNSDAVDLRGWGGVVVFFFFFFFFCLGGGRFSRGGGGGRRVSLGVLLVGGWMGFVSQSGSSREASMKRKGQFQNDRERVAALQNTTSSDSAAGAGVTTTDMLASMSANANRP